MFSRHIQPNIKNPISIENEVIELSEEKNIPNSSIFLPNKKNIEKLKITELRELLKNYKSTISFSKNKHYTTVQVKCIKSKYDFSMGGKKEVLVNRLRELITKEQAAVQIQKTFRKFITITEMKFRGPGLKNRKLCVNDTDFYTLEPLKDIEIDSFFSYTGVGGFIYGFDLNSLLMLLKNCKADKFINPYTRESMLSIMFMIQDLARITYIKRKNERSLINPVKNNIKPEGQNSLYSINTRISNLLGGINYSVEEAVEELRKARVKSLSQRVNDLFNEIDQLGNYTQAEWFSELNNQGLIRYFRCLYDIWNYRAQLSLQTKIKICPLADPFSTSLVSVSGSIHALLNLSDNQLKILCLTAMENMVLTGIDKDHKMIGSFHVLTALTVVSNSARANLPWLYESLAM